ncbi:MAG: hypothetical protein JXR88_12490 [Clostridia bacterium]|nr:hypothetical protein [Clostridia bacterium]
MKWTDCAVQDLKKINGLKSSVVNIAERIEVLEMKFDGIKAVDTTSEISGSSGENNWDNQMLDNIVERERLKMLLEADKKMLNIIQRGLRCLDEIEYKVLDYFFMNKRRDHIEDLKDELSVEKSQVYRLKNNALYKFTIHMYGIEEF